VNRKPFIIGGAVGLALAGIWFIFCYAMSLMPAVSPVSLSIAFRPWWQYWYVSVGLFLWPIFIAVDIVRHRRNREKKMKGFDVLPRDESSI